MSEIKINEYVIRSDLLYTETHEWIKVEGSKGFIGLTDYAQKKLLDIVAVVFPETGKDVKKGESVAEVESVKAVFDIYTPISGRIASVNEKLNNSPELINNNPYGEGWIIQVELSNEDELKKLLNAEKYSAHIQESDKH